MIRIDLHLHSTFSDGALLPGELVALGKKRGVSVMSLTDHDTTAGLPSFMAACGRSGIRGVAGVELSADFPSTLHILGYRIDFRSAGLEKALESIREARNLRNRQICDRLQSLGLHIVIEDVEAEAAGDVAARPHIARVMIRKGYVQDQRAAFSAYLGRTGRAYVPRERLSPEKCIELIREAGGVAVLAHPVQTSQCYERVREVAGELKDAGLWGMECYSSKHDAGQIFRYLSIASGLELFPTAGSDFHGGSGPSPSLGISVPLGMIPWARLGVSL
ncbi:MAG: PHP domain-containing protein [Aminivibrio sp.]|jgi:predicted metal-dependent phosphoesterase TrpH